MNNFTESQLKALNLDNNLLVNANAGSGKTAVLVERFYKIIIEKVLNNECKIEQIVAITFTKKAAAEMLSRVIKKINNEIETTSSLEFKSKLLNIRNNMVYARISTIHSFCSQLLKDYPIEAAIPYNFIEINEYENKLLIKSSINEIITEILDGDIETVNLNKISFLNEIIKNFNLNNLRELIIKIVSNGELCYRLINFYKNNNLNKFYENIVINFINNNLKQIIGIIENVNIEVILSDLNEKHYNNFNNNLKSLNNLNYDCSSLDEVITNYIKLIKIFKEKIGRKQFYKHFEINQYSQLYKTFYKLQKIFENYNNDKLDLINIIINDIDYYIKVIKKIIEITEKVEERYWEQKLEIPALTFDDMLIKTSKMLENNIQVRKKVKKNIKYLLIDEFQDTNHIQYNIIKKIAYNINDTQLDEDINIFLVGDRKQSIYSFRNSDVRIFNNSKEELASQVIELKESFRMLPNLSVFFNSIFNQIMQLSINEFDVEYTEFINGLNNESNLPEGRIEILITELNKNNFQVDINKENIDDIIEDNSEDISDKKNQLEAKNIANLIIEILENENEKYNIYIGNNKTKKPNPSDIAILCRKRKNLQVVARELLNRGIPYEISSGQGFFQTMEVLDLQSCIRFFWNNNDDIAFASLLKSYFFNLDDSLIIEIILFNNKYNNVNLSLWKKFEYYIYNFNTVSNEIKEIFNIINFFQEKINRLTFSKFLIQFITDTNLIGKIKLLNNSEQIEANIWQFIDYVREFENKGLKNISDLINEINTQIEESNEAEAAIFSERDTVKILTVHSSKGLEFPIVILGFSNFMTTIGDSYYLNYDLGIGIKLNKEDGNKNDIIYKIISNKYNESEEAELKRLFYVATTRAKNHLIISGHINIIEENKSKSNEPKIEEPKGFFKILLDALSFLNIDFNENFDIRNYLYSFNNNLDEEIPYYFQSLNNKNYYLYFKNYKSIKSYNQISIEQFQIKDFTYIPEIKSNNKLDIISASKIISFQNEELNYDYKYFLGLTTKEDKKNEGFFVSLEDENDQIVGTIYGTVIHYVLEKINLWLDEEGNINHKVFNKIIEEVEKRNFKDLTTIKYRLINECINISKTKFIRNNSKYIKNAEFELNYSIPFESDILVVAIDMIFENDNKNVVINDWKSNKIDNVESLSSKYEFQMLCYAYIMSFVYPNQEIFQCNLLSTYFAKEEADDSEWIYSFYFTKNDIFNFENYLKKNKIYLKEPLEKINIFLTNKEV